VECVDCRGVYFIGRGQPEEGGGRRRGEFRIWDSNLGVRKSELGGEEFGGSWVGVRYGSMSSLVWGGGDGGVVGPWA